jgi:hypothetical protein
VIFCIRQTLVTENTEMADPTSKFYKHENSNTVSNG